MRIFLFFTFQYLMTKTAAMHLQGRGGDLSSHHQGGLGGMGGGGVVCVPVIE